ncbi:tyrosine-type recombinase/integrase [Chloroflexota bacterium]
MLYNKEKKLKTLEEIGKNIRIPDLTEVIKDMPRPTWVIPESPSLEQQRRDFAAKFASELIDGLFTKQGLAEQQPQHLKDSSRSTKSVSTHEAIEEYLESKRSAQCSPNSIKSYKTMLNHFFQQFPLLPTSPQPIESFLANKKGQTASNYYTLLKTFYKFANQRKDIPNPMHQIGRPKAKQKEADYLTMEQWKVLLSAVRSDRERALAYLYGGQAFRLSEALRLNIRDIGEDVIKVHGKEREETMPLLPEVREALLKLTNGRGVDEPVFLSQRSKRLSPAMAETNVQKLFQHAGIHGLKQKPHTLRHTFATLVNQAGLDIYGLAQLLRHKIRGTITSRYIHTNIEDVRQMLERYSPLRLINGSQPGLRKRY